MYEIKDRKFANISKLKKRLEQAGIKPVMSIEQGGWVLFVPKESIAKKLDRPRCNVPRCES